MSESNVNDPIAAVPEKCPWCGSARKTVFLATDFHGNPFPSEVRSWSCNSGWTENGTIAQSHCCREECLSRQLATVTARGDQWKANCDTLAGVIQKLEAENAQLRVMAGLLEQCNRLKLPNGRQIEKTYDGTWHHKIVGTSPTHHTALAAIRAGMGWDREEGT